MENLLAAVWLNGILSNANKLGNWLHYRLIDSWLNAWPFDK